MVLRPVLEGEEGDAVPEFDDEVVTRRGEVPTAGGEGEGPDGARVGCEGVDALPLVVVRVSGIQLDRVVIRGRSEELFRSGTRYGTLSATQGFFWKWRESKELLPRRWDAR